MKILRKLFSSILVISMCISINIIDIQAENLLNNGIIYKNNTIQEIKDRSEMNVLFKDINITNQLSEVEISGVLLYENEIVNLLLSGNIYDTVLSYQKGNSLVVNCADTDKFDVLSVIIEKEAKSELLLKPNKLYSNQPVIKMVLRDRKTNDIIYIEDKIQDNKLFERLSKNVIATNDISEEDKLFGELSMNEQWFVPFIIKNSNYTKINISEDTELITEKTNSDLQKQYIDTYSTVKSVSVPDIPYSDSIPSDTFTKEGKAFLEKDSNTYFGYFKESNEWPIGSENILTNFIQWEYQEDYPRSSSQDEVYLNIKVLTSNTYLYNKNDNSVNLYDNTSYLQLDNINVGISSNDASNEFFYMRRFYGDTGGTTYHPIKAFLGGCPYASNFYWAWSELINDKKQDLNGSEETWPASRSQQEASNIFGSTGNVNRAIAGECTEYLRNESQNFKIEGKLHDYGTSSKKIYYHPKFSVYSRNGWMQYNVLEETIHFNYYISYYR